MFVFEENAPIRLKNAKEADPNQIGTALSEIASQHGGELRPNYVVEAAKDETHPLHRFFEWDDKVAAHAYRVDQARALIRIVRVEIDEEKEPVRAFYSINDGSGQRYHPVERVMSSATMQVALWKSAKRDLEAFKTRYRAIMELVEPVSDVLEKVERKIAETEHRAAA